MKKQPVPISERLLQFCGELPECCESYLLETGIEKALSTRIRYANELTIFFDYIIQISPFLYDKEKRDLTVDDLKTITPQDISRYLNTEKLQNLADRTLARKRATLSSFFQYLVNNRLIEYNPVSGAAHVKVSQSDEVIHLTDDEQEILLHSADTGEGLTKREKLYHSRYAKRDLALIMLILDTGMRVSEVNAIDLSDIDFKECSIYIRRKGGNYQTIYFSDETKALLLDYIYERGKLPQDAPLFATIKGERLSIRAIQVLVKKYATASLSAKGQHITVHRLRASMAMSFIKDPDNDLLTLQKRMNHKSLQATNIYAKATHEQLKQSRNWRAKQSHTDSESS